MFHLSNNGQNYNLRQIEYDQYDRRVVELYYQIIFNQASDTCEVVVYIKDYSYDVNFLESHLVTTMARTAFQYVKPYTETEPAPVDVAVDTTVNDLRPENNNYNHRS